MAACCGNCQDEAYLLGSLCAGIKASLLKMTYRKKESGQEDPRMAVVRYVIIMDQTVQNCNASSKKALKSQIW